MPAKEDEQRVYISLVESLGNDTSLLSCEGPLFPLSLTR
jgi:hypothetical protein